MTIRLLSILIWTAVLARAEISSKIPPLTGQSPDEQLLFCTTRIEAKTSDGKRSSVGTGFIVSEKITDTHTALFIVTCRHVVQGFDTATVSFVTEKDGKPDLGKNCMVTLNDLKMGAFFDPDPTVDIALIPLFPILKYFEGRGQKPFFRSLDRSLMPDEKAAQGLSTIQPVLFIGYPSGIRDEKNLLPVARRGITATPYSVDYNDLPLFLIDATVFPGSSGSPVLVFDQGSFAEKSGGIVIGSRAFFLGLISEAYFRIDEGEVKFKQVPTAVVPVSQQRSFLNLGVVVKSPAIFHTIDEWKKAHPIK